MLAEKGDAAQLGAHDVVQILRNAGTFPFQHTLLFQTLQVQLQFFAFPRPGHCP